MDDTQYDARQTPKGEIEQRFLSSKYIAKTAGDLASHFFVNRNTLKVETKSIQDYVSNADKEVEKKIIQIINAHYPHDQILGEESGFSDVESDYIWIIDPIDGTANFVNGIPHFCVSIALCFLGKIHFGVIYDPIQKELFDAFLGEGAFLNGEPIKVSNKSDLAQSTISCGHSFGIKDEECYLGILRKLFMGQAEYRHMGSAALGLAHTACGRVDGYWEQHISSWDFAAGILLVEEAGGWINESIPSDWLQNGSAIMGTNHHLKETLQIITGIR